MLKLTAGAAATAVLASVIHQTLAERRDASRYLPPGRMVDIGGRRIHLWAEGDGGPTVVVVPCMGGAGIAWVGVQRLLRDHTTVCLVDRGGLGWSDSAPWPRTFDAMADELAAALEASDLPRPFVLVGHSTGGLIARLTAARHRELVAALLLVDSSHEEQMWRLDSKNKGLGMWRYIAQDALNPPVLRRVTARRRQTPEWLPADLADAYRAMRLTGHHWRADIGEMVAYTRPQHHLRDEARQLGDFPVTMITAGTKDRDEPWYPQWLVLQAEIATYADNTTRVFADHCGHHVHHDDPKLVADVIRDTLDRLDTDA